MSVETESFASSSSPLATICEHDETAIPAKDPLTVCDMACRRIFAINVTGPIGVGKSLVMKNTKAFFDSNPQHDVKCVLVDEGADDEEFGWWLNAYINGVPRDDGGPPTKVSCGVFQMAITTLIRGPKRAEGRTRARTVAGNAPRGTTVVILMERAREDAIRIFMPANREMLTDSADIAIFNAESQLWHANAVDVGEPLPDATILLSAKSDTIKKRMDVRDREAERGYADSYPHKVWERYTAAHSDWGGRPTRVVDAEASPDKVCTNVAAAVMELIKKE